MNESIYNISYLDLLWAFIPVFAVIVIFIRWSLGVSTVLHGLFRMCLQLILVGYVLNFIFDTNQPLIILMVLSIMLAAAAFRTSLIPVTNSLFAVGIVSLPGMMTAGGDIVRHLTPDRGALPDHGHVHGVWFGWYFFRAVHEICGKRLPLDHIYRPAVFGDTLKSRGPESGAAA